MSVHMTADTCGFYSLRFTKRCTASGISLRRRRSTLLHQRCVDARSDSSKPLELKLQGKTHRVSFDYSTWSLRLLFALTMHEDAGLSIKSPFCGKRDSESAWFGSDY